MVSVSHIRSYEVNSHIQQPLVTLDCIWHEVLGFSFPLEFILWMCTYLTGDSVAIRLDQVLPKVHLVSSSILSWSHNLLPTLFLLLLIISLESSPIATIPFRIISYNRLCYLFISTVVYKTGETADTYIVGKYVRLISNRIKLLPLFLFSPLILFGTNGTCLFVA